MVPHIVALVCCCFVFWLNDSPYVFCAKQTADSVTEKENRPVPSRDEEDGEPEGIGDDSRAVPPAPPREPPADYAEPEQFVEREVAP